MTIASTEALLCFFFAFLKNNNICQTIPSLNTEQMEKYVDKIN